MAERTPAAMPGMAAPSHHTNLSTATTVRPEPSPISPNPAGQRSVSFNLPSERGLVIRNPAAQIPRYTSAPVLRSPPAPRNTPTPPSRASVPLFCPNVDSSQNAIPIRPFSSIGVSAVPRDPPPRPATTTPRPPPNPPTPPPVDNPHATEFSKLSPHSFYNIIQAHDNYDRFSTALQTLLESGVPISEHTLLLLLNDGLLSVVGALRPYIAITGAIGKQVEDRLSKVKNSMGDLTKPFEQRMERWPDMNSELLFSLRMLKDSAEWARQMRRETERMVAKQEEEKKKAEEEDRKKKQSAKK